MKKYLNRRALELRREAREQRIKRGDTALSWNERSEHRNAYYRATAALTEVEKVALLVNSEEQRKKRRQEAVGIALRSLSRKKRRQEAVGIALRSLSRKPKALQLSDVCVPERVISSETGVELQLKTIEVLLQERAHLAEIATLRPNTATLLRLRWINEKLIDVLGIKTKDDEKKCS